MDTSRGGSSPSTVFLAAGCGATVGVLTGALLTLRLLQRKPIRVQSLPITRWGDSERSSAVLQHNGVVYLSGQVGIIEKLGVSGIKEQTTQTLEKIEELLALAGTDKTRILSAQIWLRDIDRDFSPFNQVWNAWVPKGLSKGVRACVQAKMARETILVEISVTAAAKVDQE